MQRFTSRALRCGLVSCALSLAVGCSCGREIIGFPDAALDAEADAAACAGDSDCDDGLVCNGVETCAAGACEDGAPPDCDDGVECTIDDCSEAEPGCTNLPDHTACAGGMMCDAEDGCLAVECTTDADCDDGESCNGVERCDASGMCAAGEAPACDDGVECTVDECDPALGASGECTNEVDHSICDNTLVCDGLEQCDAELGCVAGTPRCDDGVPCTTDSCAEPTGACGAVPNDLLCPATEICDATRGCVGPPECTSDAECDDARFCNGLERCDSTLGACVAGDAPTCDDSIACTIDFCDLTNDACANEASDAECNDTLACTGAGRCAPAEAGADARGCVASAGPDCSDGIDCTVDACTEPAGACTSTPDDARCAPSERCDALDGCTARTSCAMDSECDDGRVCNGVERCASGTCAGGTSPSCDDMVDCTADACDPTSGAAGACVHTPVHSSCTDNLACTGEERCDATLGCRPGTPVACDDALACTMDACVEPGGTCSNRGTDADMDLHVAMGCASGDDCNDADASVHPGVPETCNGVDDNCSGAADEGFECALGSPPLDCTTGCGTPGTRVCGATCTRRACAGTEVCNGCDDDGDATADDGFACAAGSTTPCTTLCGTPGTRTCAADCSGLGACIAPETCNGCDDDADGAIDDNLGCAMGSRMDCTTSCGTAGQRMCADDCSAFGACVAGEACNGCDDDADGMIDDGLGCAMGSSMPCTTACGTAGSRACADDCSGYSPACVAAEACNACDDDGDGTADDGLGCVMGSSMTCTTACGTTGGQACAADCSGYSPTCVATEACNGCDDDADALCDETFACCQGTSMPCMVGSCAGTQTCSATCTIGACNLGAAPANDLCAGATMINASTTVDFRTCGATDNDSAACGGTGSRDVVYQIVLSVRSRLRVTTTADFAAIAYLRGPTTTCPTTGATVLCDDDASFDQQLAAGTYWLVLDGRTASDAGAGTLNVRIDPVPANDLCTSPTTFGPTGGTSMGNTAGAAGEHSGSACGEDTGSDVFYAINVAVPTVVYAFADGGAGTDFSLHLRAGCSGVATAANCNADSGCVPNGNQADPQLATVVGPGMYTLAVDSPLGSEGAFTLRVFLSAAGTDTPLGQARRIGADGVYTADMRTASPDSEPPPLCSLASGGQRDLTWFLTACPAQAAATRHFDTCMTGSGDSILYVRRNDLLATDGACNDDGCATLSAVDTSIDGAAVGGSLWLVVVDEWIPTSVNAVVTLNVTTP